MREGEGGVKAWLGRCSCHRCWQGKCRDGPGPEQGALGSQGRPAWGVPARSLPYLLVRALERQGLRGTPCQQRGRLRCLHRLCYQAQAQQAQEQRCGPHLSCLPSAQTLVPGDGRRWHPHGTPCLPFSAGTQPGTNKIKGLIKEYCVSRIRGHRSGCAGRWSTSAAEGGGEFFFFRLAGNFRGDDQSALAKGPWLGVLLLTGPASSIPLPALFPPDIMHRPRHSGRQVHLLPRGSRMRGGAGGGGAGTNQWTIRFPSLERVALRGLAGGRACPARLLPSRAGGWMGGIGGSVGRGRAHVRGRDGG